MSAPAIAAPETPAGPMSGMSGVSGLSGDMLVRRAPMRLRRAKPGWPADGHAWCQDLGMGMGTESVDETRESAAPMEDSAPAPMDSAPMVEAATASTDAAADL